MFSNYYVGWASRAVSCLFNCWPCLQTRSVVRAVRWETCLTLRWENSSSNIPTTPPQFWGRSADYYGKLLGQAVEKVLPSTYHYLIDENISRRWRRDCGDGSQVPTSGCWGSLSIYEARVKSVHPAWGATFQVLPPDPEEALQRIQNWMSVRW